MNFDIVDNPPYWPSEKFNSSLFYDSESLTRTQADSLYLSIKFITALSATPGVVEASKFVIVDSNKDITGFNNITMTGSSAHLTLSGNASGIDLNGTNANISINGSGGHLIVANTESANSTGSQGALKIQGGIYTNGGNFFNSTTQMNGLVSILNTTDSTSYNNGSLTLNGGIGIAKSMYVNGTSYVTNTTDSTSITSGSFQCLGGVGISKKLYVGSNTEINSTCRVTNQSSPSTGAGLEFGYSTGSSIANIYSFDRSAGSYKKINFNDLVTYDKANNIIISRGTYDLGASLYLNDSIASGLINVNNTNKRMYIQSPQNTDYSVLTFNRYGLYLNSSTSSPFSECNANCLLDFGSQAKACSINLFGGTYSLSANNSALQLCSGGSNGITLNTGGTYDVGAQLAKFTPQGSLMVTSTVRAQGENATGFSGAGVEMIYTGGIGYIYAYDRSSLLYRNMIFNDTIYTSGLFKTTGIGTLQTSYVLTVGYNTQTIATGYGYINSGGSVGTGGSTGAVSFSAQFLGRINVAGEVDIASDRKCKTEINDLEEYEATSFIENIIPKKYIFKPDTHNDHQYGYIAQDVAKLGIKYPNSYLKHLVTCIKDENQPEFIDEDNFVSPKDCMLNLNYIKIIPLIHKYMLKQQKQIDEQQKQIDEQKKEINEVKQSLQTRIDEQQKQIDFLLQENKENNERINELVDIIQEILDNEHSVDKPKFIKHHHNK